MKRAGFFLKDFFWPRKCEICGLDADRPDRYICSDCLMRLPFNRVDGVCRRCGRPAAGIDREFVCALCREKPPPFDRSAVALRFEDDVCRLVRSFKSGSAIHLAGDFSDILEGAVRSRFKVEEITAVVPVPLTVPHRFLRGFDQCALLADSLSKRLGKPCLKLLRRKGFPKRQAGLCESDRIENVKGTVGTVRAFGRRLPDPENSCVLLIDDVTTTGSTLGECTRILKKAGIRCVWAAALCGTCKDR